MKAPLRSVASLVLLAIACAAAPDDGSPKPHDVLFPPLPDSVISAKGWVKVLRPPHNFLCGDVDAIGCYTYATRKLEVAGDLSPYRAWHTLYHEEVHMAMGGANLLHVGTSLQQDSLADAIASLRMLERLAYRCRNP
jgi:hypothetical protein